MSIQKFPKPYNAKQIEYLPKSTLNYFSEEEFNTLHPDHASQIKLLDIAERDSLIFYPPIQLIRQWPEHNSMFPVDDVFFFENKWKSDEGIQSVREWLHNKNIPYQSIVYLIYDNEKVLETTWKIFLKYWDLFSDKVRYGMHIIDETLQWSLYVFHHNIIHFGSNKTKI